MAGDRLGMIPSAISILQITVHSTVAFRVGNQSADCRRGSTRKRRTAEPPRREWSSEAATYRLAVRTGHGTQEDWPVPEMEDYLNLASEADDSAAWAPDAESAASYHRLAESYQALARFHDQISALLNVCGDGR